ncbi:GTP-binding protein [endosymbiont GvMRE of Glomus versiforme]|uniref:GTP-binding protein n=1 Tax=endosymbiont GvMRE of Glomus versiforme TaxID=2039283 RepID=UPI000EC4F9A8|nr:GTP-binding protein [endosymbiont GvMRE of Glomus versiforme]RHZ37639.1 GTPase Der [endosymbiont GvMRE of Glomus versiforme]
MSKTKKIILLGCQRTGKTTFYRKLIKNYALKQMTMAKISSLINYADCLIQYKSNYYFLIDTPSFVLHPCTEIEQAIQKQNEELIKESDLILWIIDASQEIDQATEKLNKYLRQFSTPKILILNKIDLGEQKEYQIYLFQRLGQRHLYSFSQKTANLEELMEKIISLVPSPDFPEAEKDNQIKLTIFGPPNSGKSTLLNYLLQKNRSLVSPVAGTTQEPVKDYWNWQNWSFAVADTAGISKSLIQEKQIYQENQKTFRQSDLVWVVIDATLPLTKQTFQIIHLAEKHQKPLIIIVNKCDLIENKQKKEIQEQINDRLKSLRYVPIIFLSALQGKGINSLLKTFALLLEESQKQFTKKQLAETIENMSSFSYKGGRLKIYFAKHQPGLTHYFIFFVNNPKLLHFSHQRYIVNYLRKNLALLHLPIKLIFKKS